MPSGSDSVLSHLHPYTVSDLLEGLCALEGDNQLVCSLPYGDLRKMLDAGELSADRLAQEYAWRVHAADPHYRAFLTPLSAETIRELAAAAAHLSDRPLYGMGFTYKDCTLVHSEIKPAERSQLSLSVTQAQLSRGTSAAIQEMQQNGAFLLGSTNTSEFCSAGSAHNRIVGHTHNARHPLRAAGGSSGGAAVAVALGMGQVAFGTDGTGSNRIPACLNGVYGFKSASQLRVVSQQSAARLGTGATSAAGVLTRTLEEAALVYDVLQGSGQALADNAGGGDAAPHRTTGAYLQAARAGLEDGARKTAKGRVLFALHADVGPHYLQDDVAHVCEAAVTQLEAAGMEVTRVQSLGLPHSGSVAMALWAESIAAGVAHKSRFADNEDLLDDYTRHLVSMSHSNRIGGRMVTAEAKVVQAHVRKAVFQLASQYDFIVTPTLPILSWTYGQVVPTRPLGGRESEADNDAWWNPYTYPFNWTNATVASAPVGVVHSDDDYALPVGLQVATLAGLPHADRLVMGSMRDPEPAFCAAEMRRLMYTLGVVEATCGYRQGPAIPLIPALYYGGPAAAAARPRCYNQH